jgi:hypothetical protein
MLILLMTLEIFFKKLDLYQLKDFFDIIGIIVKLIACRSPENGVHYRIFAFFTPKKSKKPHF